MRFAWLVLFSSLAASAQAAPTDHKHQGAYVAPAEMLDRLDRFRDSLSPTDRDRLDKALPRSINGGIAKCDRAEGSRASCEAAAYMPALRATGLMQRFRATATAKHS